MLKIDGVTMPNPSSYKVTEQDVDSENSGRNEVGVLIRDRLRQGVLKGEFTWKGMSSVQVDLLMSATEPEKVVAEMLHKGTAVTFDAYAGDRVAALARHMYIDRPNESLWDVSFNLIEY